jgi:N-acetylneuraminate synthase
MGSYKRELSDDEFQQRKMMRRSIVSKIFIPKDKTISIKDISFKRPGDGIPPTEANKIVGKKALRNIEADELINQSDFV